MSKYNLHILREEQDHSSSKELVAFIYNFLYDFNFKSLSESITESFPATVLNIQDRTQDTLATITISHPSILQNLPSELLFNFECPTKLKESRVVEIGKLAKKHYKFESGSLKDIPHAALLILLKGVMHYAKSEEITYWTATLHPYLANILKEIDFPYNILYQGLPIINEQNSELLEFTGKYGKEKLIYAYYPMKDSFIALEKYDLGQYFNIIDTIENYV